MPAPKANQYAAKNKGFDSKLNVECKESDKDAWKQAAKGKGINLTEWTNETLNAAAEYRKQVREDYFKKDGL